MSMKIKFISITVILIIASFIIGARLGVSGFIQSDAKFKAGLAVADLKRLDEGNIDGVRESLEFHLYHNLGLHAQSQSNPLSLLWPELGIVSNQALSTSALQNAAKYYKENIGSYVSEEELASYPEELQASVRADNERVEKIVSKYAQ